MYTAQDWQKEKVKKKEDVLKYSSYHKIPLPTVVTDVELSKIIGTAHVEYCYGSWCQMLTQLPKRHTDEQYVAFVRNNVDHSDGIDPITLHQYGDEYIISQGGNHRICHAKFAGTPTIRVLVKEFVTEPVVKANLASSYNAEVISTPIPLWERGFDWLFAKLGL